MTTAREELIAQWRQKLADARQAASSDPRRAWLAQMRVRLYRFLLSCYAGSSWSTTPRRPTPQVSTESPDEAVFDTPDSAELRGKPPKSLGQIQSVLKSVANAQEHAPEPGPLVHGLEPDSWVVVAATSRMKKLNEITHALSRARCESRALVRGNKTVVEVRAADRHAAMAIVDSIPKKRKRTPRVVTTTAGTEREQFLVAAAIGWLFLMFILGCAILINIHVRWRDFLSFLDSFTIATFVGAFLMIVYLGVRIAVIAISWPPKQRRT